MAGSSKAQLAILVCDMSRAKGDHRARKTIFNQLSSSEFEGVEVVLYTEGNLIEVERSTKKTSRTASASFTKRLRTSNQARTRSRSDSQPRFPIHETSSSGIGFFLS